MNLDPRTVVILTVLSTLLMSISLFAVARGYLAQMRGVTRWAWGTLLQSAGWVLLAMIGSIPSYIAELGSPLIMLGLALYHHSLVAFKKSAARVTWVYAVVLLNLLAIYFFLLIVPDMSARIVVASATGAVLMFFSARILFSASPGKLPVSHSLTGSLFAVCSVVLSVRAVYYLVWNTAPDQSAFEHNLIQDIAFLTFFLAGVVSSFTFILMCNDRYSAQSLLRTQELAKKNLELEEASQAKGQFLATMSHEIRTPLNGVIGFLNRLEKTRLDDTQQDYLHTIRLSARMLLSVINDVLDYSKIDAGKLAIEAIPNGLRSYLEDTISMFAASAEEKGLVLVCVVDRHIHDRLLFDPARLTQILSNLLGNAIKFTDRGQVLLEARLIADNGGHANIEFSVADTGIGIAQESQDRLFKPFMQADASTTRKYGGTGLGLVIARRLVELMGGSMCLDSTLGKGSRFHFRLELSKCASLPDDPMPVDLSGMHLLLVTPHAEIARGLDEIAGLLGIHAHYASSGREALDLCAANPAPQGRLPVVIFDQAVQDMPAVEFALTLQHTGIMAGLRMILLGGMSACERQDSLSQAGYLACLRKPVKTADIRSALHKLLQPGQRTSGRCDSALQQNAHGRAQPLRGKRILIVDDNQINLKLMQLLVADLGGEFDSAGNGREAVDACEQLQFDLILMDINMPVMDGPDAARMIRLLGPASQRIPIIALTANALPGDKERFLQQGMSDYLSKPVSEQALLGMVDKWLPDIRAARPGAIPPYTPRNTFMQQPVFDPALGVKLSFGDEVTWKMVLGLLLDDLPDFARQFDSLSASDVQQLAYLSHKLAGSSCYCGTPALNQAAKQVEVCCAQADQQMLKIALSELKLQIEHLLMLGAEGRLRLDSAVIY